MGLIRTEIGIAGLLKWEVDEGLPYLRDEFAQRPWLLRAATDWRDDLFVIRVDYEGTDPKRVGQAVLDEVWDCVIACLRCSTHLRFDVISSESISHDSDTNSS